MLTPEQRADTRRIVLSDTARLVSAVSLEDYRRIKDLLLAAVQAVDEQEAQLAEAAKLLREFVAALESVGDDEAVPDALNCTWDGDEGCRYNRARDLIRRIEGGG
jgi:hypothetical protein